MVHFFLLGVALLGMSFLVLLLFILWKKDNNFSYAEALLFLIRKIIKGFDKYVFPTLMGLVYYSLIVYIYDYIINL
ncbi:hypothetical protein F7018_05415 [Tenacibaculum aiptasiae]|uniref:Uncharacterized protein n=1 Tax=Tenacibaculum aiptasiae TaxID=426481 RepID=A0A7J5AQ48_9FLAO|nr:hypothetical protein F7018_05415 [Tenacibaculum aiptasiae]